MSDNANVNMRGVICEDVSVTIGGDKLLTNINLTAKPGTITGLIGHNGSGKTMLLRAICGLAPLSGGSITVEGQRVGKDMDFPDWTGAIIETPGFLPQYSGIENLRILARIRNRIGDGEIKAALEKAGLDPAMKKRVGKYSLGMRQRLGIAQAIMEKPRVLLLDEPMNGLDKSGCADASALLKRLRDDERCTIILASHNPLDVADMCDVVHEMDAGRFINNIDNIN